MGCAHAKEPVRKDNSGKSSKRKEYSKRKEKSDRTIYSEPTYHIKTEDYKPVNSQPPPATLAPPTPIVPEPSHGSVSNKDNTTLSSNKDDNNMLDDGINDSGNNKTEELERKGSVVRNGVYYSESELAEENTWQPKYWTPDRIGKWVEDTEFPDGMRFGDVCKIIIQSNMTVPRPRAPHHSTSPNHHQPSSPSHPHLQNSPSPAERSDPS